MRKDNSIYNKKQPGLYIYLYLQSQIPTLLVIPEKRQ